MIQQRLHFPHGRVQSLESLQYQLGMKPADLRRLARKASKLYFIAAIQDKPDGSKRELYDTRQTLKVVLKRINEHFLRRVYYPLYITGGVPRRDYTDSVDIHKKAAVVIKEDISKFFPSVTSEIVFDIWRNFFRFGDDVSRLLTDLTTRDGHLEQGAPTSGYLANLALHDLEPNLVRQLASRGLDRYSRHVDDITMSSATPLDRAQIAWAVLRVQRMLKAKGLRAKREKHEVMRGNAQIKILNLVANAKPAWPLKERARVRAMVHNFCRQVDAGQDDAQLTAQLPKVRGHVYKVKRLHEREGARLVAQINAASQALRQRQSPQHASAVATTRPRALMPIRDGDDGLPW